MNKIILIAVILLLLFVIYKCSGDLTENFENNLSSSQIDEIKNFISSTLENKKNIEAQIVNDVLNAFRKSQEENLEQRLPNFKETLNQINQMDKSLLDDLYFDLRMNDNTDVRNKLIASYKVISDFINNKEINVSQSLKLEVNEDTKKTLLNLMKDYSKNNKFT